MAALGLKFFTPQPGDTVLKSWTNMEKVARWAQYIPAVLLGHVIQVSADGKEIQQLTPSRVQFLLPLALLGGAAIYLGLQKVALIAAAVMVTASIIGVVVMSRSETQVAYDDAYSDFVHGQRQAGLRTDKAVLAKEVNKYAEDLAVAANTSGWFTGDIEGALNAFQEQCANGTTKLIQHLLTVDEEVFTAVYKRAGNFLMERMKNREMATAVMAEVVKAAPTSDDDKIARFQMFIERFARRAGHYSGDNWTSEICDAVKGNPVALAGVLTGLTAREGSIGKAMARGFTVSVLKQVITKGQLPIETLGALAVELETKAEEPKFSAYADLKEKCEARLSDAINNLQRAEGYKGEHTPQTEAFLKLTDPKVQAKWVQVSLGGCWLKELGEKIDLTVAVQGLSGDLARVDSQFLTSLLGRILESGSKNQAEAVVNRANISTLQSGWAGFSSTLSEDQVALIQMLRVKYNLDAENIDLVIGTNPELYLPALLTYSGDMTLQMIWKTFAAKEIYPQPASLDAESARAFFSQLPGAFKTAVNKIPADHEASIQRLTSALTFLQKGGNNEAWNAFVGALDNGQKAILGHHLSDEEQAESRLAGLFAEELESWKALGSVGPGVFINGFIE